MMTHWINLGLNARDRFVVATPMYFGGGRTFLMSVLCSGGTAILSPPPFAIETLPALVRDHGATSLFLVPTQLRRLLELDPDAVVPLRGCICCCRPARRSALTSGSRSATGFARTSSNITPRPKGAA